MAGAHGECAIFRPDDPQEVNEAFTSCRGDGHGLLKEQSIKVGFLLIRNPHPVSLETVEPDQKPPWRRPLLDK